MFLTGSSAGIKASQKTFNGVCWFAWIRIRPLKWLEYTYTCKHFRKEIYPHGCPLDIKRYAHHCEHIFYTLTGFC